MIIPDGIWLGLSMASYRADPALGGHDLLAILGNPVQWHARERDPTWRALNPPSEEETAAQKFGTALHCMVLEPDAFDDRYYAAPELPDLPSTKDEVNEALAAMGRPTLPKARKSVEFEAAARMAGVTLLSDWKEQQALIAGDRDTLSPRWIASLRLLHAVIEAKPAAKRVVSGGRCEVSVFWTDEHGTRFKCRFDNLRIRHAVDVKSFAARRLDEPVQVFVGAIESFGYDFLAAHYMDCRVNVVPNLVKRRRIWRGDPSPNAFGEPSALPPTAEDTAFFARVAAETDPLWVWLACMTQGYPEVDVVEFPATLMQFQSAQVQLDLARQTYREFRERFGDDDEIPWISSRPLIRLTDFNFMSSRARDRGAVRWESGE